MFNNLISVKHGFREFIEFRTSEVYVAEINKLNSCYLNNFPSNPELTKVFE